MIKNKTPAQCVGSIIKAAMASKDVTVERLADAVGVHRNTVRSDLKDPDKLTMYRMWLYFTALSVPVDEGLQSFADSFARSLVSRG